MNSTAIGVILILFCAAQTVAWVAGEALWQFQYQPEYNKAVRGHIENAYWAQTPELMVESLEKAEQGMKRLGLEPSMYSTGLPWKKTPDRRMDYQYDLLESVKERAKDIVTWRNNAQRTGQGDQLGDVYGDKVDRVRGFIKDDQGWLDNEARGAYLMNNHPGIYWGWRSPVTFAWFALWALNGLAAWAALVQAFGRRWD